MTEVAWQVVELSDGSSVQSGSGTMAAGTTSATPSITNVSARAASAFLSTQTGGGQNGGRTTYTADDVIGVASFTTSISTSLDNGDPLAVSSADVHALTVALLATLTLQRTGAAGDADYTWFLVSWGRP